MKYYIDEILDEDMNVEEVEVFEAANDDEAYEYFARFTSGEDLDYSLSTEKEYIALYNANPRLEGCMYNSHIHLV